MEKEIMKSSASSFPPYHHHRHRNIFPVDSHFYHLVNMCTIIVRLESCMRYGTMLYLSHKEFVNQTLEKKENTLHIFILNLTNRHPKQPQQEKPRENGTRQTSQYTRQAPVLLSRCFS